MMMSNNEYSRDLTKNVIAHTENDALVIDGAMHVDGGTVVFYLLK